MSTTINSITKTNFKFSPKLILNSLGEDVIEEDSIAIAEQIKNAIDAKAKEISIDFSNIEKDVIVIKDNGNGMTETDIKSTWFLLATDSKSDDNNKLGGKGVGRFSLFRLADCIKIETVSNNIKSSFTLNREELETYENLSSKSIPITIQETSEINGTTITLTKLNDIDLAEIEVGLENLFFDNSNIELNIKYPNSFPRKNFIKPDKVLNHIPLQASIEINNSVINSYSFQANYNGKIIYFNDNKSVIQTKINKIEKPKNLGYIKIFISNFYFSNQNGNLSSDDEAYLKEYFLSAYQGISIYRKNLKIYGHGENDWLKLAEKRLKRPGKIPDNKLSYGYIILPNDSDNFLKEKTNREGFIKNDYYRYFIKVMELLIEHIGSDRENAIKKISSNPIDRSSLPNLFHPNQKFKLTNINSDDSPKNIIDETDVNNLEKPIKNNIGQKDKNNHVESKSPTREIEKINPDKQNDISRDTNKNNQVESPKNITEEKDLPTPFPKQRFKKSKEGIGSFDLNIYNNIQSDKVRDLLQEILTIETESFPLATAFLYRSLTEIMLDEFLIKYLNQYQVYFKDYVVSQDGLIKLNPPNSNGHLKDIGIKSKITNFKNLLKKELQLDNRSLKYLDDLSLLIDEINLAMHWPNKTIAIDRLRTTWTNCKPLTEFVCKKI